MRKVDKSKSVKPSQFGKSRDSQIHIDIQQEIKVSKLYRIYRVYKTSR